jgi:type IV pilus assembly protein PilW
LTLIELMVAVALGMLIAAAAVSALIVARQGFRSVDTGSQLRENARFAGNLIQRIVVQAGFENAASGYYTDNKDPGLAGFDNSLVGDVSTWGTTPTLSHDTRTSCAFADTSCATNGSDVLVVRYWGVGAGPSGDGTIINCAGASEPEGTERAYSIFHVVRSSSGEPTLACTYRVGGVWTTRPLVTGVEGFQVLYGVDTLDAAGAAAAKAENGDTVADRYLTARQLDTIPSSTVAENWRRVRTVRIGLVLRSATADAADIAATKASVPVLGSNFVSADDVGSALQPVKADGRLRQRLIFTVQLRNAQFSP